MENITEDGSSNEKLLNEQLRKGKIKFIGDSIDFGLSPVSYDEEKNPTIEVDNKNWGIR